MVFGSKPLFVDVALDFDGVIHSYGSGWCGLATIPDPPVDGAVEWVHRAICQGKRIAIHSCRSRTVLGRYAMKAYVKEAAGNLWYPSPGHLGLEEIHFPRDKPAATVYIDDRAVRFEGTFPDLDELLAMKPWNNQ